MDYSRISFDCSGAPEAVLQCSQASVPQPDEGEVLVRMFTAPINPADINFVQGVYGIKPQFPNSTAGLEGYGEIIESRCSSFCSGDRVILLSGVGTWGEYLCAPASSLLKIDQVLDPLQGAMLKVNPLTAYLALTQFVELKAGDWVVQNAANSGVGRCVIQLCRAMGLRSINVVRRADELRDDLCALGADFVISEDDPDFVAQVLKVTDGVRPKLASNCVGGDSALRLMDLLAPSGTIVTFGAMSKKSIKVPNSWLIFKDISLRGLWCTKWLKQASAKQIHDAYGYLAHLMAEGKLSQAVERCYSLSEITEAVTHAQQEHRSGKILLKMNN